MFDLIHCSDRIRFLCSFFFDSEIRQNIFKNRPHDRGTDRSSIIYALRIVYNTDSKDPGIFCRNKSKKRGNVFICTSRQCLGSRCLSSYMISFDIGLFAASFGNDFFENHPHCLGNLLRYDLFSFLIRKCFQQSTVIFPHFHPKMRRDLMAAIDQGTHRCCQTDRRDLKGLSERDRCQFHRPDILFLMHDRPCLSRKIDSGLLTHAE